MPPPPAFLPLDTAYPPQISIPSPSAIKVRQDIFSHDTKGDRTQGSALGDQEMQIAYNLDDLDFSPSAQGGEIHTSMVSEPKIKIVDNLDQVTLLMNASKLLMTPRQRRLPSTTTTSEATKRPLYLKPPRSIKAIHPCFEPFTDDEDEEATPEDTLLQVNPWAKQ